MAIYVIDMKHQPPVVVLVTDDAKDAASIARRYADANNCDVHLVDATPNVVVGAPPVQQPITDPAMANAHNVLPVVVMAKAMPRDSKPESKDEEGDSPVTTRRR